MIRTFTDLTRCCRQCGISITAGTPCQECVGDPEHPDDYTPYDDIPALAVRDLARHRGSIEGIHAGAR